jgi:hypothetical protein
MEFLQSILLWKQFRRKLLPPKPLPYSQKSVEYRLLNRSVFVDDAHEPYSQANHIQGTLMVPLTAFYGVQVHIEKPRAQL